MREILQKFCWNFRRSAYPHRHNSPTSGRKRGMTRKLIASDAHRRSDARICAPQRMNPGRCWSGLTRPDWWMQRILIIVWIWTPVSWAAAFDWMCDVVRKSLTCIFLFARCRIGGGLEQIRNRLVGYCSLSRNKFINVRKLVWQVWWEITFKCKGNGKLLTVHKGTDIVCHIFVSFDISTWRHDRW